MDHNKKQTEMADLLHINYQNYSKMERDVYHPSLEKLIEICDILYITPNDLLLEGRDFDDYKKEYLEKMDAEIIGMLDIMHIIEEERATASIAHTMGDYVEENIHLQLIYDILVKEDNRNISFKKQ